MEFLEKILGEELYKQVAEKINAHNGNEANKENLIKLANLATGDYVAKGKYDSLQTSANGKDAEIENYKKAIADLQKANKSNEDIQQRINQLETENAELKAAQEESDKKYAFDLLLMDSGVTDKEEREFLVYKYENKLKEEGRNLELDENKHIKGAESIVESLKTMRPKAFETGKGDDGYKPVPSTGLPRGDQNNRLTKEELLRKPYSERMELFNSNPEAYKAAMNS